jgi:hypothetical protein
MAAAVFQVAPDHRHIWVATSFHSKSVDDLTDWLSKNLKASVEARISSLRA